MVTKRKSKQEISPQLISDIIDLHFRQKKVCSEITSKLGVKENWLVSDTIDTELNRRVDSVKKLIKAKKPYRDSLIDLTMYLKQVRSMPYYEIAKLVGLPELEVYEIVFIYPTNGGKKSSLSREEKIRRDETMVKLNTEEGLTLKQIAIKFHVTKQRVSAIFKSLNYTPINTRTLKDITAGKYASKFAKIADEDMATELLRCKKEIRAVKQRSAVSKYHYNKTIISLRCRLIMQYMLRWSDLTAEERADYGAHRRVLEILNNEMKNTDIECTQEQALVKEMLIRVQAFEKATPEVRELLQSDLPTYKKIKERISEKVDK